MDTSFLPDYAISSLCRICAEKSLKLNPIFENKLLPIKINKCLPISIVADDNLPVTICERCEIKVNEQYDFYETVLIADQKLKWLWNMLLKKPASSTSEKELIDINNVAVDCVDNSNVFVINEVQPVTIVSNDGNLAANTCNIIVTLPDQAVINVPAIKNPIHANETNLCGDVDATRKITEKTLPSVLKSDKINSHKQSGNSKKYQCQFCSRQLSTMASLSVHESTHSQENPYLCDSCGKSFKHANNLRSHARTHLSIRKKFVCKICNKSFLTNFFLKEHMNSHTGETPYKCQDCGKEFRERVHLRQHRWTHSSDKFVCEICGTPFSRKGNMKEHIKKHHNYNKEGDKDGGFQYKKQGKEKLEEYQYQCGICSKIYSNETYLKIHLKSHSSQQAYYCSVCGKKFRHSGSLTYHRRTAHTGEKPFQCSYCNEKFSLRSVQIIHERKNHTFEQPYKCPVCSRSFTNSSSLKNHSYIHMKDKIFDCNECGKKFARKSNLLIHSKLHSNDRQFSCDQCGKSYIQKHDLIKHKKIHDPKRKPFFCKFCGNNFSHKKDVIKHAVCQLDYSRKKSMDICSAEKILDSVSSSFPKDSDNFYEAEKLILETVKKFTNNHDE